MFQQQEMALRYPGERLPFFYNPMFFKNLALQAKNFEYSSSGKNE
jgi:hypothetical protein